MNPMARRLTIWGTVLLAGVMGGVTLGNFVAAGGRTSGADELAAYFSDIQNTAISSEKTNIEKAAVTRSGPTSYECEGCDAGLYKVPEIFDPAEYLPLPPYEAVDLAPPLRRDVEPPDAISSRLPQNVAAPTLPVLRGREPVLPVSPTNPEQSDTHETQPTEPQ